MIEVPRGAVTADEIAEEAEFFSFGTNDLTQMGCGFSRDDAGKFLQDYVKKGIYEYDPFQTPGPDRRGRADAHRRGQGPQGPARTSSWASAASTAATPAA